MKDRTLTSTFAPTSAPAPMPGRLAVNYYDDLLRTRVSAPLDAVKDGTHVRAAGVITSVRHLDPRGGRVHAVLTDTTTGDTAVLSIGPDAMRLIAPIVAVGTPAFVAGFVKDGHTATVKALPPYVEVVNGRLATVDDVDAGILPVPLATVAPATATAAFGADVKPAAA